MKATKSKKGITLVELIIACAVMALVFVAAAGALNLALDNYKSSNIVSNNLQNATILEEYIKGAFSTAQNISLTKDLVPVKAGKKHIYFSFNANNDVVVTERDDSGNAVDTAVLKGIESIEMTIKESGKGNSRRLVAEYVISLPYDVKQNTVIKGSIALKNSAKTSLPTKKTEKICAYHNVAGPGAPPSFKHDIRYLTATLPD